MKNKIIQHFFAKDKGGEFKMALGILSIFMMSLFVLSFIFVWFMWTTKRQKLQQTMMLAKVLLTVSILLGLLEIVFL